MQNETVWAAVIASASTISVTGIGFWFKRSKAKEIIERRQQVREALGREDFDMAALDVLKSQSKEWKELLERLREEIRILRAENADLRKQLESALKRIADLESTVDRYHEEQGNDNSN